MEFEPINGLPVFIPQVYASVSGIALLGVVFAMWRIYTAGREGGKVSASGRVYDWCTQLVQVMQLMAKVQGVEKRLKLVYLTLFLWYRCQGYDNVVYLSQISDKTLRSVLLEVYKHLYGGQAAEEKKVQLLIDKLYRSINNVRV